MLFHSNVSYVSNVRSSRLLPLLSKLSTLTEMVETVLQEVAVGDSVSILPHTDSYCLCMAFLLAWTQVLEFIAAAPSQVRTLAPCLDVIQIPTGCAVRALLANLKNQEGFWGCLCGRVLSSTVVYAAPRTGNSDLTGMFSTLQWCNIAKRFFFFFLFFLKSQDF